MAGAALLKQGEQRRKAIVKYIEKYRKKHPYGPTIAEIAEAVGLQSANATRHHLMTLRDEGKITMEPRVARSIAIRETPLTQAEKRAARAPKLARAS